MAYHCVSLDICQHAKVIEIGKTFCGWTYVCMDGRADIETGFIRSTQRCLPKNWAY